MPPGSAGHFDRQNGDLGFCFGCVWPFCKTPVITDSATLEWVRPWAKGDEAVERAITYFANQSGAGRMDYASRVAADEPIGSGVTEAACKVIVKQRLCRASAHLGVNIKASGEPLYEQGRIRGFSR